MEQPGDEGLAWGAAPGDAQQPGGGNFLCTGAGRPRAKGSRVEVRGRPDDHDRPLLRPGTRRDLLTRAAPDQREAERTRTAEFDRIGAASGDGNGLRAAVGSNAGIADRPVDFEPLAVGDADRLRSAHGRLADEGAAGSRSRLDIKVAAARNRDRLTAAGLCQSRTVECAVRDGCEPARGKHIDASAAGDGDQLVAGRRLITEAAVNDLR